MRANKPANQGTAPEKARIKTLQKYEMVLLAATTGFLLVVFCFMLRSAKKQEASKSFFLAPIVGSKTTPPLDSFSYELRLKSEEERDHTWMGNGQKEYIEPKQMIFMMTDYDEKKALLNIDGRSIELLLNEVRGNMPKNWLRRKEGDRLLRVFSAQDITARAEYLIDDASESHGCVMTHFTVFLEVRKGRQIENKTLVHVRGC